MTDHEVDSGGVAGDAPLPEPANDGEPEPSAAEVSDDDVIEIEEGPEELNAAMRELFALEIRRIATERFRTTRLRDREREREARERAAELRSRIVAEAEARLRVEHERDVERDRLHARVAELVSDLASVESARDRAETRAEAATHAARIAEGLLAKSQSTAFERGLDALRRTIRWTSAAVAFAALLLAVVVLGDESIAQAVHPRSHVLPLPSETVTEVEVVTGAARPWVASAPAEKPTLAPVAVATHTSDAPKPRLSRTRSRATTPSNGTPNADHDDDPLGGLDM